MLLYFVLINISLPCTKTNLYNLNSILTMSFVVDDPTKALLDQLQQATYHPLPTGSSSEEDASQFVNIVWQADLELQAYISFYEKYVPVATVILAPRRAGTPDLPESMRVTLSAPNQQKATILKSANTRTDATTPFWDNYAATSATVDWKFAQIILGRADAWLQLSKFDPTDLARLAEFQRSFSLNFISSILTISSMSLASFNSNSPWAATILNCTAFAIDVAIPSMSAGLAIGIVGLTTTTMDLLGCSKSLMDLSTSTHGQLKEVARIKILTKAATINQSGEYYIPSPNGVEVYDANGKLINTIQFSDPSQAHVSGTTHGGETPFVGDYREDDSGLRIEIEFNPSSSDDSSGSSSGTVTFGYNSETGEESEEESGDGGDA